MLSCVQNFSLYRSHILRCMGGGVVPPASAVPATRREHTNELNLVGPVANEFYCLLQFNPLYAEIWPGTGGAASPPPPVFGSSKT